MRALGLHQINDFLARFMLYIWYIENMHAVKRGGHGTRAQGNDALTRINEGL